MIAGVVFLVVAGVFLAAGVVLEVVEKRADHRANQLDDRWADERLRREVRRQP